MPEPTEQVWVCNSGHANEEPNLLHDDVPYCPECENDVFPYVKRSALQELEGRIGELKNRLREAYALIDTVRQDGHVTDGWIEEAERWIHPPLAPAEAVEEEEK